MNGSPEGKSASDVLIVGAGPTGVTLAPALANRGIRVTIIDRQAEGANTSPLSMQGHWRFWNRSGSRSGSKPGACSAEHFPFGTATERWCQ